MSRLSEYAERLRGDDATERAYAAEDIGYANEPEGVALLVARLNEESCPPVRGAIFGALTRMDGEAALAGAVELLHSDSPQVRNQAVEILRHKGTAAVGMLREVMRNGDKDMRKLVLDALLGTAGGEADAIHAAALRDSDPNVVITAVENLGRVRAEAFREEIEGLLERGTHPMLTAACLGALTEIGNRRSLEAVRRCSGELAQLPDYLLAPYLRAIGALGGAREFGELAAMLGTRKAHLQGAILGAMLETFPGDEAAAPNAGLLALLREICEGDGPALCRYQATQLLGMWAGEREGQAILNELLDSKETLVRLGAAEILRPETIDEEDPSTARR